ncbi:bifunctional phosphoglucose/phosphomannose isomerase [bacterium]|nr:bifunctional phosphoglucose/phosphomannose isomerase [bacterium]
MKYQSIDKSGMYGYISEFPKQLERSWHAGLKAVEGQNLQPPRVLVWAGMGGSAIGGDYCSALCKSSSHFPVYVHRGGRLPAWIGKQDRLIAVSFSGNTAETLQTVTEVHDRGTQIDILTSGGKLAKWAEEQGITPWLVPGGKPPRSALGDLFAYTYAAICGRGWCSVDKNAIPGTFAELTQYAGKLSTPDHSTELMNRLLSLLSNRLPMIYGTGIYTAVARRWMTQINENAKRPAHWGELPEMNHNEVVAYVESLGFTKTMAAIFLIDPDSPDDVKKRVEITAKLAEEVGIDVEVLSPQSAHPFARLMEFTILGDWLSFWMAIHAETDPTPIEPIDKLKSALG